MKTSELTGIALDWAVEKCDKENNPFITKEGLVFCQATNNYGYFSPTTYWSQGGPIIEREELTISPPNKEYPVWASWNLKDKLVATSEGPTPLIAAMRCYVASKLGNEVDIPKELL